MTLTVTVSVSGDLTTWGGNAYLRRVSRVANALSGELDVTEGMYNDSSVVESVSITGQDYMVNQLFAHLFASDEEVKNTAKNLNDNLHSSRINQIVRDFEEAVKDSEFGDSTEANDWITMYCEPKSFEDAITILSRSKNVDAYQEDTGEEGTVIETAHAAFVLDVKVTLGVVTESEMDSYLEDNASLTDEQKEEILSSFVSMISDSDFASRLARNFSLQNKEDEIGEYLEELLRNID